MSDSAELSIGNSPQSEMSFLSLPCEVHFHLLRSLDFGSQLVLRRVNHYFYDLVSVVDGNRYHQATELLLGEHYRAMCLKTSGPLLRLDSGRRQLEERLRLHSTLRFHKTAPINYNLWNSIVLGLYPCYTCMRWLAYDHFSQSLTRTVFVLGGPQCAARMCMQCGIDIGVYVRSGLGVQHSLHKAYNHCRVKGCKTVLGPRSEAAMDKKRKVCEKCVPRTTIRNQRRTRSTKRNAQRKL